MTVTADASIEIPEVADMPVKKISSAMYDSDDFELFKQAAGEALGIKWGDERTQTHGNSFYLRNTGRLGDREYVVNYSQHTRDESEEYAGSGWMYMSNSLAYQSIRNYEELPDDMRGEEAFEGNEKEAKALVLQAVFESIMKRSASDYGGVYVGAGVQDEIVRDVQIKIDHVRLGYMSSYEKVGDFWRKTGKQILVWDFYGSVAIQYPEHI